MRSAVFLDRDGVLNRAIVRAGRPYAPRQINEFEILPDAPEACQRLREAGFLLIVVTNQPDVARGLQTREQVETMHARLRSRIPLDDVRVCVHDQTDGCRCRKPSPGMLIEAATDWNIDLRCSFIVGDRWTDIEAGRAAECHPVLIDRGYNEPLNQAPDYRAGSLAEAVDWILRFQGKGRGQ